jgi:hypothetical protein
MKSWTEFHIAVVYYCGISVSLFMGILSVLYLKPFYYIKEITKEYGAILGYHFTTTIFIAGILGAMSVSFVGCNGNYDSLLESPSTTLFYGLCQISFAGMSYAIMMGVWFFILLILHMVRTRGMNMSSFYKIICLAIVIGGICWFYNYR